MSGGVFSVGHMMIDCASCTMRGLACGDCVVSFLTIERRPGAFEVDNDQAAAMSAMALFPLPLLPIMATKSWLSGMDQSAWMLRNATSADVGSPMGYPSNSEAA